MDAVAPSSSALARASAELSMAITCSNARVCVFFLNFFLCLSRACLGKKHRR